MKYVGTVGCAALSIHSASLVWHIAHINPLRQDIRFAGMAVFTICTLAFPLFIYMMWQRKSYKSQ
jgi:hypothetical protein